MTKIRQREPEKHIRWSTAAWRRLLCSNGCHRDVCEEVAPPQPGKCHVLGRWDIPCIPNPDLTLLFLKQETPKAGFHWMDFTREGSRPTWTSDRGTLGRRRDERKIERSKGVSMG